MRFEVIFHYYERQEETGKYDMDNTKTFTKKIGKGSTEDVSYDDLAALIMKQLARRDIWIFDVNLHEYCRREISFKEVKGGVIIKNKKYLFDNLSSAIVASEELPETPQVQKQIPQSNNHRVVRYEIFDPESHMLDRANRYRLTKGQRYPILREFAKGSKLSPLTFYIVRDDSSKEVEIAAEFFVAMPSSGLIGGNFDRPNSIKLSYDDQFQENKPIPFQQQAPAVITAEEAAAWRMPDITKLKGGM